MLIRRRLRGLSLVEVLVASALLALVLGLTVRVFVPALRAWTRGAERDQAQRSALVASRWLRRDVHRSSKSMQALPHGLLLVSLADPPQFDESGQPVWSLEVYYWRDASGRLHRQTRPLPAGTDPASAPVPARDPDSRCVARGVDKLQIGVDKGVVTYSVTTSSGGGHCSIQSAVRPLIGMSQ